MGYEQKKLVAGVISPPPTPPQPEWKRDMESDFEILKAEILKYPRLCGYYKIELADISDLRLKGLTQDQIIDHLYEMWADHEAHVTYRQKYPFPEPKPEDLPSWTNWEGEASDAIELLAYGLQGGGAVGHTVDAIAPAKAQEFAERFVNLFHSPRMYRGLGFGDPMHVFEHGILLLDDTHAGMLLIVESD